MNLFKIFVVIAILVMLFVPESFAARRITLVNGSGVAVGTIANPLYVQ